MAEVAKWHARVVGLGGGLTPDAVDAEPMAEIKRSRTLKLLQSYFPDRFVPINSMNHMAKLLAGFGGRRRAHPRRTGRPQPATVQAV